MDAQENPLSDAAALPDLEPATRRIAALLGQVDDSRLDSPTPCPDYAVRELLGHLTGLATAFRDAARKDLGASTAVSPDAALPVLDDDWREVLPRRLEEVAAAWRSPDAWTGLTRAGGVELPGEVAGAVALNELVVHGWAGTWPGRPGSRTQRARPNCGPARPCSPRRRTARTAHPMTARTTTVSSGRRSRCRAMPRCWTG